MDTKKAILVRHYEHPIRSRESCNIIYLCGDDLVYWLEKYGEDRSADWIKDILNRPPILD